MAIDDKTTTASNACNSLPIRKISHSSARSGMLRKPALGKVLVALVLSCVIGAGVEGCKSQPASRWSAENSNRT